MGRAAAGAAVLALTDQAAAPVQGGQRIGYHCHLADSYVYYTILLAFLAFNTVRVQALIAEKQDESVDTYIYLIYNHMYRVS